MGRQVELGQIMGFVRANVFALLPGPHGTGFMSTFGTYLFRQTSGALVLILLSLCGVVWIALALKELKLITSKGQDVATLLTMTTLAIPNLLAIVAPVALLVATIHVLNRLNGDSELIVVTASGGSIWRVVRPLLALAGLVALLVAFVNHIGMPWSLRQLRVKIMEVRSDLISQVLIPGRFSTPETGVIVHIRSRTLDGRLQGLLIRDERRGMAYLAEQARIVKDKDNDTSYLAMENGHILRGASRDQPTDILGFTSYAIDLERFERRTAKHTWRPKERYLHELLAIDPATAKKRREVGRYRAELHERLSSPLYPFLFVLLGVAFVGQAQSTRQNRTQMVAMAFFVAALFRGGGLAMNNLVVLKPHLAPLMYALPLAGFAFALILIVRNAYPKPGLSTFDRLEMFAGDVAGSMKRRFSRPQSAIQAGE
ncbi:MAG: LPS export ABC transporter permease LptF [Hyphomicrobiaceae bacterium]